LSLKRQANLHGIEAIAADEEESARVRLVVIVVVES
jgi:hypothetical protein